MFPYSLLHPFFYVVISKETVWMLEITHEESEARVRKILKPGVLKLLFQEADGEIKLNWFTQKLDTEYQVKCQKQGKNYKICKHNNYTKE